MLEIKALENKGQNLEEEQKIAVKKLDGVCETIDNLKEIGKHVTDGLTEVGSGAIRINASLYIHFANVFLFHFVVLEKLEEATEARVTGKAN